MELYINAEYPFWFSAQNRMRFACGISEVKMASRFGESIVATAAFARIQGAALERRFSLPQAGPPQPSHVAKWATSGPEKALSQPFKVVGISGPGTIFRGASSHGKRGF